jgi:hypothetical protein
MGLGNLSDSLAIGRFNPDAHAGLTENGYLFPPLLAVPNDTVSNVDANFTVLRLKSVALNP